MGVLEQVNALKNQGLEESAIANQLKDSGVSPKDISEALNHVRIKKAVSSETPKKAESKSNMQPSIMANPDASIGEEEGEALPTEGNLSDQDLTPPKREGEDAVNLHKSREPVTHEMKEPEVPKPSGKGHEEEYVPTRSHQEYLPQGQMHAPQNFQAPPQPEQQDYGYAPSPQEMVPGAMGDTDTTIEIAEQVFIEKIKNIQKKVEDLTEFKTLAEVRIENISDRLKRIEHTIDALQADILEKVGSYGRGIDSVKREMEMVQESFGKVVNDLARHGDRTHHVSSHRAGAHSSKTTSHTAHKTTHSTAHAKKKVTKKKK